MAARVATYSLEVPMAQDASPCPTHPIDLPLFHCVFVITVLVDLVSTRPCFVCSLRHIWGPLFVFFFFLLAIGFILNRVTVMPVFIRALERKCNVTKMLNSQ